MATWFLGLNRGQQKPGDVAISTTAPSTDIYLQILSTNSPTRKDVIMALKVFEEHILNHGITIGQSGVDMPPL